jgi:hypothetical protein
MAECSTSLRGVSVVLHTVDEFDIVSAGSYIYINASGAFGLKRTSYEVRGTVVLRVIARFCYKQVMSMHSHCND